MTVVEKSDSARHVPNAKQRLKFPHGKSVLMLGTDPRTQGGIAAVIETLRSGGLFEQVPVTFVSTHEDGGRTAKGLRFVRALRSVTGRLVSRRTALVHAHVSSHASFWRKSLLLLIARCFGVPTIFHLHSGGFANWSTQEGMRFAFRRWWVRHTLEASDSVILLTRSWATWASDFAPRSRVTVIGNPVQIPAKAPSSKTRGSRKDAGRVLFLGWIYDFKGVYDLLQAWAIFREQCKGWRLVVGGKGEVDQFIAAAVRFGVRDDLEFLGWVTGKEKVHQLCAADIFVLPSYNEGMPVSLLEAMAFGAAVIATPVGGVPDMMEPNVHGLWVQPGDPSELAERLCELADSSALRERLACAAYTHVATNYAVESSITSLISLYRDITRRC